MMEEWRDIKGYEGSYQISNLGRIKTFKVRANFYPDGVISKGYMAGEYMVASITKNKKRRGLCIHKLIAHAFIPNPLNRNEVNHIDGNKLNNAIENLEWCTHSENVIHAFKTGLMVGHIRRGEKSNNHKLSSIDVSIIKSAREEGFTQKQIATYFKISQANVSFITHNKRWNV